jgi:hypothetical protein
MDSQKRSPDQVVKFEPKFMVPHYCCVGGSKPLTGLEQNKFIQPLEKAEQKRLKWFQLYAQGNILGPILSQVWTWYKPEVMIRRDRNEKKRSFS